MNINNETKDLLLQRKCFEVIGIFFLTFFLNTSTHSPVITIIIDIIILIITIILIMFSFSQSLLLTYM